MSNANNPKLQHAGSGFKTPFPVEKDQVSLEKRLLPDLKQKKCNDLEHPVILESQEDVNNCWVCV